MMEYGTDTDAGRFAAQLETLAAAVRVNDANGWDRDCGDVEDPDYVTVDGEDPQIELDEMPLDVEIHGKRSLRDRDWTITTVEVLLGCGGPTVWVEFRESDRATVHFSHLPARSSMDLDRDAADLLASVWGVDLALEGEL